MTHKLGSIPFDKMKFPTAFAFAPSISSFPSSTSTSSSSFTSTSSSSIWSTSLPFAVPQLCMVTDSKSSHHDENDRIASRRSFLNQKAIIATSGAFYGSFLVHLEDAHSPDCMCSVCEGTQVRQQNMPHHEEKDSCQCSKCLNVKSPQQHDGDCQCRSCVRWGPFVANAYERDVGDENRSPETFAMNLQVSTPKCNEGYFLHISGSEVMKRFHAIYDSCMCFVSLALLTNTGEKDQCKIGSIRFQVGYQRRRSF